MDDGRPDKIVDTNALVKDRKLNLPMDGRDLPHLLLRGLVPRCAT